jgi:hypothetical protein
MAKALHGHLGRDTAAAARLDVENARLRGRVADLEALVRHLSEENDRLVADLALHRERDAVMQPA